MWIKVGDQPEINVEDIAPDLEYLSESSSPAIANTYTDNAGIDGSQYNYSAFGRNVVTANFVLHFSTWYSFELAKHDIYRIFSTKQVIRIRTDSSPAVVKYVRSAPFEIKPISDGSHDATFSIPFENPSGYLYSLVNSDVLKEYSQNAWQYGENLPNGKDLQYQFVDQSKFSVYNASDIPVDPYFQRHELKIIIKHNGGAFGIQNETTGDLYRFNGSMNSNDTLMIDGINSYLNGNLVDNQTNYGYISLATGWNSFKTISATDLDITFSFPFIYLG
ncbi:phage tail domain-containing protein [Ligilactobacillus acidipiscis]|nr:phage tail domain-containing protein [Ligilactobacillus acidipiscis]